MEPLRLFSSPSQKLTNFYRLPLEQHKLDGKLIRLLCCGLVFHLCRNCSFIRFTFDPASIQLMLESNPSFQDRRRWQAHCAALIGDDSWEFYTSSLNWTLPDVFRQTGSRHHPVGQPLLWRPPDEDAGQAEDHDSGAIAGDFFYY